MKHKTHEREVLQSSQKATAAAEATFSESTA